MRAKLIKWIRYFLGISRTEANGVVLMAIVLLLISFLPMLVIKISKPTMVDIEQEAKLDSLAAILEQNLIYSDDVRKTDLEFEDSTYLFSFDPNKVDKDELLLLGLSLEISNRILSYRRSGGRFNTKEDLRKIYGLSEDTYKELLPYLTLESNDNEMSDLNPELIPDKNSVFESKVSEVIVKFDINDVDSSELLLVNGIGPILSGRIVRFRESLGGFVSMDQLVEVYGLEDYAKNNLLEQAYVKEDFKPEGIHINQWPIDSLVRHPYIDFNRARVIVAYREQHGIFLTATDLKKIVVLDQGWVDKLTPYLDF